MSVKGYTTLSEAQIGLVNRNKEIEEQVLRILDALDGMSPDFIDARWLAIGRTNIEQGFMAVNRSIFKPERLQ